MKKLTFIFFIFLNNFCFSQQKVENEYLKYETSDFSIFYNSETFDLKVHSEKCESLFCTMFDITKKSTDEKPVTSIIQLKINDCSQLGVGTYVFEKELKDKNSNYTKITTLDNFVYYERITKVDNLVVVDYVSIKNHKVYTLKCIKELIGENENCNAELEIMNFFRVK